MPNFEKYYMSTSTGEVVFTHREAMELYRAGHEVQIFIRIENQDLPYVTWVH